MEDQSENKKRIISLGFERPKELQEDTIYVDFKYSKNSQQISGTAYSNEGFSYHAKSLGGDMLTRSDRHTTTRTGNVENSWEEDYKKFTQDLKESNNGEIVNQRLIEDGSVLVAKILQSKKVLEDFLYIKSPHTPKVGSKEKP